jgi:hypothetical protein
MGPPTTAPPTTPAVVPAVCCGVAQEASVIDAKRANPSFFIFRTPIRSRQSRATSRQFDERSIGSAPARHYFAQLMRFAGTPAPDPGVRELLFCADRDDERAAVQAKSGSPFRVHLHIEPIDHSMRSDDGRHVALEILPWKECAMPKLCYATVLPGAFIALFWLAACTPPVQAQEAKLSIGHGVVCDTPEEVEAVVTPSLDDVTGRLESVNDRFGKESCNIVTAVFYKGDVAKSVLISEGIVHIVKVKVLGVQVADMWMQMGAPKEQYVGVLEPAESV